MHISELSQKSGVEARKAGRVLRILASKHIFREGESTSKIDQMNCGLIEIQCPRTFLPITDWVYNFSGRTRYLALGSICLCHLLLIIIWSSRLAYIDFYVFTSTDECIKSAVLFSEVLGDKEWGPSYAPHQTAFNKYSGYPDSLFKYFEGVRSYIYIDFDACLNDFAKGNS